PILVNPGASIKCAKHTYFMPLFEPRSHANFTWFSMNYRLAPQFKYPAAVEDVESAIRFVRQHAKRYKVDPNRIALIGESAGGHLVSMAGARNKAESRGDDGGAVYGSDEGGEGGGGAG